MYPQSSLTHPYTYAIEFYRKFSFVFPAKKWATLGATPRARYITLYCIGDYPFTPQKDSPLHPARSVNKETVSVRRCGRDNSKDPPYIVCSDLARERGNRYTPSGNNGRWRSIVRAIIKFLLWRSLVVSLYHRHRCAALDKSGRPIEHVGGKSRNREFINISYSLSLPDIYRLRVGSFAISRFCARSRNRVGRPKIRR